MSADIGDEVLKIQMPNTKGASGKPKFRNIKLGERAHAYGAFLDGKKKEVDALFEQWDQIQGKIICLATRLLGPEIVDVSDPEEGTQLRQDVSEAVKSYKKTHKNQQNELERMQEIEEAAKELSAETRGTIDGIAQVRIPVQVRTLALTFPRTTTKRRHEEQVSPPELRSTRKISSRNVVVDQDRAVCVPEAHTMVWVGCN